MAIELRKCSDNGPSPCGPCGNCVPNISFDYCGIVHDDIAYTKRVYAEGGNNPATVTTTWSVVDGVCTSNSESVCQGTITTTYNNSWSNSSSGSYACGEGLPECPTTSSQNGSYYYQTIRTYNEDCTYTEIPSGTVGGSDQFITPSSEECGCQNSFYACANATIQEISPGEYGWYGIYALGGLPCDGHYGPPQFFSPQDIIHIETGSPTTEYEGFPDAKDDYSEPATITISHDRTSTCYLKVWFADGSTYEWSDPSPGCSSGERITATLSGNSPVVSTYSCYP
jgi:hypothetical protein